MRQLRSSGRRAALTLAAAVVLLGVVVGLGVSANAHASGAVARSGHLTETQPGFSLQPITVQRVNLPSTVTEARWPVFTSDGQHLLFWDLGQLWIASLQNGADAHCLTCGLLTNPNPTGKDLAELANPFPDGKRIFFEEDAQVQSAAMEVLTCTPSVANCQTATLTPVEYQTAEDPVVAPGGSTSTPQVGVPNVAAHAQLSPDGQYIGFSEARTDSVEAMIIGKLVDNGSVYTVTDPRVINPAGPSSSTDPSIDAWSQSSSLFEFKTFTHGGADATYVQGGGDSPLSVNTWSVNLATGARTLLVSHPDWNEDNGVSPDGKLISVFSDRTIHYVDWIGGLLPVPSFIDSAGSTTSAAATGGSSECMGPMWLMPSTGDDGGNLMGEPLVDYKYPGVHVVDTLAEESQWSPDGTMIALNTIDDPTGNAAPFLLVAHLGVKPSAPQPVVSSQPGAWAPSPANYHGAIGFDGTITLHGPGGGTVTVTYDAVTGGLVGTWSETYANYSQNGRDFVNGTITLTSPSPEGPATWHESLVMTGADTGNSTANLTFSSQGISGTASSTYDGNTISGPLPVEKGAAASGGPSTACPGSLPKEPALTATATLKAHGEYQVAVTVAIAGAGPNEADVDTQPVQDATVQVGGRTAHTNAAGVAIVKGAQRTETAQITAGDTLLGTSLALPALAATKGCPKATGSLSGPTLGLLHLGMARRTADAAYPHSTIRRQTYQDFICLATRGVRVGYPSARLLRAIPRASRAQFVGRVVLVLTGNATYALHGVKPGATLTAARAAVKLSRPLRIGQNTWFLAANGRATGVLKTRDGKVQEVGIATKQLTTARLARTFLSSFG